MPLGWVPRSGPASLRPAPLRPAPLRPATHPLTDCSHRLQQGSAVRKRVCCEGGQVSLRVVRQVALSGIVAKSAVPVWFSCFTVTVPLMSRGSQKPTKPLE